MNIGPAPGIITPLALAPGFAARPGSALLIACIGAAATPTVRRTSAASFAATSLPRCLIAIAFTALATAALTPAPAPIMAPSWSPDLDLNHFSRSSTVRRLITNPFGRYGSLFSSFRAACFGAINWRRVLCITRRRTCCFNVSFNFSFSSVCRSTFSFFFSRSVCFSLLEQFFCCAADLVTLVCITGQVFAAGLGFGFILGTGNVDLYG